MIMKTPWWEINLEILVGNLFIDYENALVEKKSIDHRVPGPTVVFLEAIYPVCILWISAKLGCRKFDIIGRLLLRRRGIWNLVWNLDRKR